MLAFTKKLIGDLRGTAMLSSTAMLIEEADRLVERAVLRMIQYRHHLEELKRAGRESDGAQDVLNRMQASLDKLRLYRDVLGREEHVGRPADSGKVAIHGSAAHRSAA
jgi:hypothetical protein